MQRQIRWLIVLLSGFWLTACKEDPPPTREEVIGVYIGNYLGGKEVYDIRPDETFSQTFVKDGHTVYSSTGTWKLMEPSDYQGNIEFSPHMRAQDWNDSDESVSLDTDHGSWLRSSPDVIVFFRDKGILVVKQKLKWNK
ncbi:MAG: hypothetical protein KKH28_12420 [Elusimicrobia bacterium]|nr:hypothetical protein [Elusimicrobiota bacterium]